jgi:hypothetical protein
MMMRKLCKVAFKLEDEFADGPKQFLLKRLRSLWLNFRVRALEDSASAGPITMEQALLLAERAYEAEPYSGSVLLIRFHDEAWEYGPDPLMGWSSLVRGGIKAIDLEGGHVTGMGPRGAPTMAGVLRDYIEACEVTISATAPSSAEPNVA